jgi:hypothetical protein
MSLLIGAQFYAGPPDAARRQEQAIEALLRLRGVTRLNIQWVNEVYEHPAIETLAVLRHDSRTVTRLPVRRKPIMPELFDALAAAAATRGCRYFGFVNADILVSQAAVDLITREQRDAYAFSRLDIEPETGRALNLILNGLDLFAFTVDWWRRERHRFRRYILAEWFYDCVFGALIVCHGNGMIVNRDGEIRHEAHPQAPSGLLAHYNGYLAALDAPYFSLWVRYRNRLDELRKRHAPLMEELALQRETFVWRPSVVDRLVHVGRQLKARWRYRQVYAEMSRELEGARGGSA